MIALASGARQWHIWAMFSPVPVPKLNGRGGFVSLLVFAVVFASWVAIHWFGPGSENPQSQMVYLTAIIVVGTFGAGVTLALLTVLIKAMRNR